VLSELGWRQTVRLGEYFRHKGITFDAALTGTLQRQLKTFAGICEGMGTPLQAAPWAGLNEYDSEAVIAAIHPQKLEKPSSPEMYRSHFRLLKDGLKQWMDGVVSPKGMPDYSNFVAGVTGALDHIRASYTGNVLLVSSGGPIATAVGQVLGTSPETTIELNLRIRNASVTEFSFTPKRHMLVTYNTLPHLDAPEHADWITYS
jgi:broad specificity phosphatase PhoE